LKIELIDTLAGKEYESFLRNYGFDLALDENGTYFSCTVVQSKELLLAFTYQMNMGQNISLAELGAPINAKSISERKNGWSQISEVWDGAWDNFHQKRKLLPYPHELDREEEILVVDETLRTLISKIRNSEVSVSKPNFRMEKLPSNE
jgi:hypothetical protein